VLFQKGSEVFNSGGSLLPLFIKVTAGLFAAVLIPAAVLIVWAPQIFSWVFGEKWFIAGEYARWLVFWMIPVFCNVASVLFAQILRQQRNLFIISIIFLICRTLALVAGGHYLSILGTIILFSVTSSILNTLYIVWVGCLLLRKRPTVMQGNSETDFLKYS